MGGKASKKLFGREGRGVTKTFGGIEVGFGGAFVDSERSEEELWESTLRLRVDTLSPAAKARKPHGVRHEYEYCDVCVDRSDDNMLDVCFQDSQLTSDPTTTPQQCNKGDRQRCQSR